jgi:hypothetical protein
MKKSLLFTLFIIITLSLQAQKDSIANAGAPSQNDILKEAPGINVIIYPVPVRDNSFTIKTDRDISVVKVTNIIGQDISRVQFDIPQQMIKVFLDNPKRGMYLVTIIFSDKTRVVKKIMVEESK